MSDRHHKDNLPVVYVTKAQKGRGRPRFHDREELLRLFHLYIEETQIPIVAEFAYFMGLHRQQLYDFEELRDAIKLCITKKEVMLERLGMTGQIDKTMAIFSLKQMGWRDRWDEPQDVDRPPVIVTGGLPD